MKDALDFLLTNRIPRRLATALFGRFSRVEHPWVARPSLWLWRTVAGLDLSDAREARFRSVHHCFTRQLRPGARPPDMDPAVLASPCDAIVGAAGTVGANGTVLQVKGQPYTLDELLLDAEAARALAGGTYATLRLTARMYHRFHAPYDARVEAVTHVPGDAWNVNPPALARVPRLFCRNERAAIRLRLASGAAVWLVPVAAILVAGLRLRFLRPDTGLRGTAPQTFPCDAALRKGEEMGWFEHGSTVVVLAPPGFVLCAGLEAGRRIRAGEALMRVG